MKFPPGFRSGFLRLVVVGILWGSVATDCLAVILYRTDDAAANTTAPTGTLANSGWQWEGNWGLFLGTPIAPHFFLSAKHIGQAGGSVFSFGDVNYTIVKGFPDPNSDLDIWQVAETFPSFAPLYTKSDEVGKTALIIGRGTQRGTERYVNSMLAGWDWGAADNLQRWGQNRIASIVTVSVGNDFLYSTFDANGLTEEAALSVGDSGGAAFIKDGTMWKLAGIHYAVDGPFYLDSTGTGGFNAALFDSRGLYYQSGSQPPNYVLISGGSAVPAGFYPTRISTKLAWIYSVIDPSGDLDGDGISNLVEYALHSDPLSPGTANLPVVGIDGSNLTLTYSKVTTATDIGYVVERSTNLTDWSTATPTNEVIATNGNVQTIKASVAIGGDNPLFLRLRITRQ